jgi:sodium/potassium/calcium exchanger 6
VQIFPYSNYLIVNDVIPFAMVILGITLGIVLAIFVIKTTRTDEPPTWFWTLSFLGFFVALNWIFLLANEVVGLLQVCLVYISFSFY